MLRKTSLKLAAVSALGLVALLTGCAAESDAADSTEPNTPADATTDTASDEPDAGTDTSAGTDDSTDSGEASGSLGGSYSLTVDGESVVIDDAVVACQVLDGSLSIGVASTTGSVEEASGLGAVVTTGDPATVTSVGALTADGKAVAYAEGAGVGSAEVTVDGDTYEITGTGLVTDLENPTSMDEADFEFIVTCP